MIDQQKLEQDGEEIEKIMKPYTDNAGAHLGFIETGEGKYFCIGGRTDLLVYGLAEAIAYLAQQAPEASEILLDTITATVRTMLARMEGGAVQ